ncbi:MAG TPA: LssY C-terminal domain-containing protein [Terriglobia bacterium]|nr:LssY C-terminal domain-containing protein [Terriglobia bacterium]
MKLVIAVAAAAALAAAAPLQTPEPSTVQIRLMTPVASSTSKPDDRVEAVVVWPFAGAKLHGRVKSAQAANGDERAELELEFDNARVTQVDNARESVDKSGRIIGIAASESFAALMDRGLEKLGKSNADMAAVLQAVKGLLIKEVDPEIVYPAGVEMTAVLTKPTAGALYERPADPFGGHRPPLQENGLVELVRRQPLRTRAERPALPSDWTNLLFIGSRASLEKAFKAAGWTPASAMNASSVLETARAIIEARGYHEAPVSKLRLEDSLPDMVFQKTNNTFAKRHHLRIWHRSEKWQGEDVWIGAATHDTGIAFASDERSFFHTIDPEIDKERMKVMADLTFAGSATVAGIVDRVKVPSESTNATGDRMLTDGKMAVVRILD